MSRIKPTMTEPRPKFSRFDLIAALSPNGERSGICRDLIDDADDDGIYHLEGDFDLDVAAQVINDWIEFSVPIGRDDA